MRVHRRVPSHSDGRGEITDILVGESVDGVSLITARKGAVRGNHYHEVTEQYLYMLSGRLEWVARSPGHETERVVMEAGDIVHTPPGEHHALRALEDCAFLALSRGPRRGANFEDDTYRLAVPLISPR